jgi:hypothetical protein
MRTAITSDEQRSAVTQREGNTERGMRRLSLQVTKREQGTKEVLSTWQGREQRSGGTQKGRGRQNGVTTSERQRKETRGEEYNGHDIFIPSPLISISFPL